MVRHQLCSEAPAAGDCVNGPVRLLVARHLCCRWRQWPQAPAAVGAYMSALCVSLWQVAPLAAGACVNGQRSRNLCNEDSFLCRVHASTGGGQPLWVRADWRERVEGVLHVAARLGGLGQVCAVCVCVCVCVCGCMYVCLDVCMDACMSVCKHVYTCIATYICIDISMYKNALCVSASGQQPGPWAGRCRPRRRRRGGGRGRRGRWVGQRAVRKCCMSAIR